MDGPTHMTNAWMWLLRYYAVTRHYESLLYSGPRLSAVLNGSDDNLNTRGLSMIDASTLRFLSFLLPLPGRNTASVTLSDVCFRDAVEAVCEEIEIELVSSCANE